MKKIVFLILAMALMTIINAAPVITLISPIKGEVGDTITITGTGFNSIPENNIVCFGATRAIVFSASTTSLKVTVPYGATYAPITVLNTSTSLIAYSSLKFTPTFSPVRTKISQSDFILDTTMENISAYEIVLSDVDLDGKSDLVFINGKNYSKIAVMRNLSSIGNLKFANAVNFLAGSSPSFITVGDIDGDGKPDIVVTNQNGNSVSVLRNTSSNGIISFAPKVDFNTGSAPIWVAISDIDLDGKPDLAVANLNSYSVSVLRNTGNNGVINFADKIDFALNLKPTCVTIGDLDNDGKADLAIGNSNFNFGNDRSVTSTITVLRNTGNSGNISFAPNIDFSTKMSPLYLTVSDIDGDGKSDLVFIQGQGGFGVLRNTGSDGSIGFAPVTHYSTGDTPYRLAICDVSGDGKPDVIVPNYFDVYRSYSIWQNDCNIGSISFINHMKTNTNPYSYYCVSLGDLDGDGRPDMVFPQYYVGLPSSFNSVSFWRYTSNKTWTGATNSDWSTSSNWTDNAVPVATDDVNIPQGLYNPVINNDPASPAICNNLTLPSDGNTLTIAAGKALTVKGTLSNSHTNSGLIIQSDAVSGTGSLIAGTFVAGSGAELNSTLVQRNISGNVWHLVTPPLMPNDISHFLQTNNLITTNGLSRGMMAFNPLLDTWNAPFENSTTGGLVVGQGFALQTSADCNLIFTGMIKCGSQTISGLNPGAWNCIGNPYTSAIGINSNGINSDNFLNVNGANLDPVYGAAYFLEKSNPGNVFSGQYTAVSKVSTQYDIQSCQGFFVKLNSTATSVTFTPAMQYHNGSIPFKASAAPWPMIKLKAAFNSQQSSTLIAFNSSMTNGLDPSYDAGLLRAGADLVLYSKLVGDNKLDYTIQALPDNDFNNLVIPIGIDFKTGGEVTFSSELTNLPANCKVILEDKQNHVFTDLSLGAYKATLAANSSIANRFYIHTSYLSVGLANNPLVTKYSVYVFQNSEIHLKGPVSKNAIATLYDAQGKLVLVKKLTSGTLNIVPIPYLKTGIYMLSLNDEGKMNGFKILINR